MLARHAGFVYERVFFIDPLPCCLFVRHWWIIDESLMIIDDHWWSWYIPAILAAAGHGFHGFPMGFSTCYWVPSRGAQIMSLDLAMISWEIGDHWSRDHWMPSTQITWWFSDTFPMDPYGPLRWLNPIYPEHGDVPLCHNYPEAMQPHQNWGIPSVFKHHHAEP